MSAETMPFDLAEFQETDEEVASFLNEALATGDAKHIAGCLKVALIAKGLIALSKEAEVPPEQLCRFFNEEETPSLKDTLAVIQALGISLAAEPAELEDEEEDDDDGEDVEDDDPAEEEEER